MRKPPLLERLRAKKTRPPIPVAVGWYTPEQWARVKASAADPDVLERTFEEWEVMALNALKDMRKAGLEPVKQFIQAEELLAWCLARGKPVRADARAEFVLQKSRGGSDAEV